MVLNRLKTTPRPRPQWLQRAAPYPRRAQLQHRRPVAPQPAGQPLCGEMLVPSRMNRRPFFLEPDPRPTRTRLSLHSPLPPWAQPFEALPPLPAPVPPCAQPSWTWLALPSPLPFRA